MQLFGTNAGYNSCFQAEYVFLRVKAASEYGFFVDNEVKTTAIWWESTHFDMIPRPPSPLFCFSDLGDFGV